MRHPGLYSVAASLPLSVHGKNLLAFAQVAFLLGGSVELSSLFLPPPRLSTRVLNGLLFT